MFFLLSVVTIMYNSIVSINLKFDTLLRPRGLIDTFARHFRGRVRNAAGIKEEEREACCVMGRETEGFVSMILTNRAAKLRVVRGVRVAKAAVVARIRHSVGDLDGTHQRKGGCKGLCRAV